jgi:hypothetical protein
MHEANDLLSKSEFNIGKWTKLVTKYGPNAGRRYWEAAIEDVAFFAIYESELAD